MEIMQLNYHSNASGVPKVTEKTTHLNIKNNKKKIKEVPSEYVQPTDFSSNKILKN